MEEVVKSRSGVMPPIGFMLALVLFTIVCVLFESYLTLTLAVATIGIAQCLRGGSEKTSLLFDESGIKFTNRVSVQAMRYQDVAEVRLRGSLLLGKELLLKGNCRVTINNRESPIVRDRMTLPDIFVRSLEEILDDIRLRADHPRDRSPGRPAG